MNLFCIQLLFISQVLQLLARIGCSSQGNVRDEIVYRENYSGEDEILALFADGTSMVFDISKIKDILIFPTQYYQTRVMQDGKALPVFMINATKKDTALLLKYCYEFNATEMQNELELFPIIKSEILRIQDALLTSFRDAEEFNSFLLTICAILYDTEYGLSSILKYHFQKVRCLIPVVYFANLNFITKSSGEKKLKIFPKFSRENIVCDESLSVTGLGVVADYFNIKIFLENSFELQKDFVFKMRKTPFSTDHLPWDLHEFTIFQQAKIEDRTNFNTVSCLVIDKSSGLGLGYLTKLERYGDLRVFITDYFDEADTYFFQQLLELAKSMKSLHLNGIFHNKISASHVLVDENSNIHSSLPNDNYRFLLAYFDDTTFCYATNSTEDLTEDKFCSHCENRLKFNWLYFGSFLSETYSLLASKYAEKLKSDNFVIITGSLKNSESYADVKNYLNDVISNSIFDRYENDVESYKFKQDASFVIMNYHGKNTTFNNGDLLRFDIRFHYNLYYSTVKKSEQVYCEGTVSIVEKINEFAKEYYGIDCLLENQ